MVTTEVKQINYCNRTKVQRQAKNDREMTMHDVCACLYMNLKKNMNLSSVELFLVVWKGMNVVVFMIFLLFAWHWLMREVYIVVDIQQ